ncbi:MAG: hypothetical protein LBM67_08745 [Lentimicrobiaceae bacterium]|jgi:hypothetical protein|nr:hypothetical protein [Lentimicrobiaceae bacterium]
MSSKQAQLIVSQFVSTVFHPLLLPSLAFLILILQQNVLELGIPPSLKWYLLAVVLITSFLMPASIIFLVYKLGFIKSLQMEKRSDRVLPLLVTAVFFLLTFFLLGHFSIAPIFLFYLIGATMLTLFVLGISLFWKISLHATGFGGFTAALLLCNCFFSTDLMSYIAATILIAGLVCSARLLLHAHKPSQVYVGFLTGLGFISGLFYVSFLL